MLQLPLILFTNLIVKISVCTRKRLQKRKSPVRGLVQMASQTNVARRSMMPMPMRACSKVTATTPRAITHLRFSHHAAGSAKNLDTDMMIFFLLSISTRLLSSSCYRAKKPLCRNSTGYVVGQPGSGAAAARQFVLPLHALAPGPLPLHLALPVDGGGPLKDIPPFLLVYLLAIGQGVHNIP